MVSLSKEFSQRGCRHADSPLAGDGSLGSRAMTGPASATQEGQHIGAFPSLTLANC